MNSKKALIIANTRFELFLLTSICLLLNKKEKWSFVLLVKPKVDKEMPMEVRGVYSQIKVIDFPFNPLHTDISLKNVPKKCIRWILDIQKSIVFKSQIRKFVDEKFDLVLISSFREYFANILVKELKKRSNTPLVAIRSANQDIEKINKEKRPVVQFIANCFNFLFGFSLMDYRWNTSYHDACTNNYRTSPYDQMLYMTSDHKRVKERGNLTYVPGPFIALRELYDTEDTSAQKICVIGERTPLNEDWNARVAADWNSHQQKRYDAFLDYLRKEFSEYELYFHPHPLRTDMSQLNLEGFTITSPENIHIEELFVQKKFNKIISVKSTPCKIAVYFGSQSYIIFPWIELSPEMEEYSERYFSDDNQIIRVKKLDDLKKKKERTAYTENQLSSIYNTAIFN